MNDEQSYKPEPITYEMLVDLIRQHAGNVVEIARAIGYTRQGIYYAIHRHGLAARCVKARQQAGVKLTYRMWGHWAQWQEQIMEEGNAD